MVTRVLFVNAVDSTSEVENRYRPLWPATLAAYVEKFLGPDLFEFRFLAGRIEADLKAFRPDIVAISAVSQNYNYAKQIASISKKHGLTVVVGGIHISSVPSCLTPDMDVGCIGEGEETFLELMQEYSQRGGLTPSALRGIRGIVHFDGDELVVTPERPMCLALDQLPHPKRSLIGYQSHDYMFTSRGCPYHCVFCASSRYWQKIRFHSAAYVIEEIAELVAHGVRTISFYDDLFIADKQRLREISARIVAHGFHRKVRFTCSCRANLVTPDVVEILRAMNVVSVGMGLESGCDRTLKYLKGQVSVSHNWQAVNLLKNAGIQANGSFVIGAPDETEAEIMETYNFIRKSRLDFPDIYVLTPLPGTPIWEYAAKRNLVSADMDWPCLNVNFEANSGHAIILSETLTRQQVIQIYGRFQRLRFYRILKALPASPWRRDVPRAVARLITGWLARLYHASCAWCHNALSGI